MLDETERSFTLNRIDPSIDLRPIYLQERDIADHQGGDLAEIGGPHIGPFDHHLSGSEYRQAVGQFG